jgi:MFS family permease
MGVPVRTYRDLLKHPDVLNVTASQLFARLPLGMLSLAILLHVQGSTNSYSLAGAVAACAGVGEALAMPVTARLTGRVGMVPTLVTAAVINCLSMLALAFAGSSPPLLMGLGLLVGASVPPLMPVVRALYPHIVPRDAVRALFALDTTAQELIWVIGPVAVTFLVAAASSALPLVLAGIVTLLGTAWFLIGARHIRPTFSQRRSSFGSVLANRAVLLAMIASLAMVASFTALEVGVIAALGRGVISGMAIAGASVGSLIGGLAFGHRRLGLPGVVAALAVVAIGTVVFGLSDNRELQFAALFFSGLGFAPAMSALYIMVSREIEEHAAAEAFGWLSSAALVGGAIGTAVGGVAVDAHGSLGAVVAATVLAVIAAVSPIVARTTGPLHGLTDASEPAVATVDSLDIVDTDCCASPKTSET